MPDYDLRRLSSRSFEQLAQAIANRVLGHGLVIFGDGPDGGREATFSVSIPYPSTTAPWEGYTVVQAKFLQNPKQDQRDAGWLIGEIDSEIKKYKNRKIKVKQPENFLIVTNVVLSAVADAGGKDRVDEYMQKQKLQGGFYNYDIWDYDRIRVFLDQFTEIRHSYAAWITPGDVLAVLLKTLSNESHDLESAIHNCIAKEFLADLQVNLEQAGSLREEAIAIFQVFFDLMWDGESLDKSLQSFFGREGNNTKPKEDEPGGGASRVGLAQSILKIGAAKLDGDSLLSSKQESDGTPSVEVLNRIVIVGGAGARKVNSRTVCCSSIQSSISKTPPSSVSITRDSSRRGGL